MNGLPGDDSWNRPGGCVDDHTLAEQDLHVPSAYRVDSKKPHAVNVPHDQPDLVAMSIQHDGRSTFGIDRCMNAAVDIRGDTCRKFRSKTPHHFLDLLLSAGSSRSLKQFLQKRVWHYELPKGILSLSKSSKEQSGSCQSTQGF